MTPKITIRTIVTGMHWRTSKIARHLWDDSEEADGNWTVLESVLKKIGFSSIGVGSEVSWIWDPGKEGVDCRTDGDGGKETSGTTLLVDARDGAFEKSLLGDKTTDPQSVCDVVEVVMDKSSCSVVVETVSLKLSAIADAAGEKLFFPSIMIIWNKKLRQNDRNYKSEKEFGCGSNSML